MKKNTPRIYRRRLTVLLTGVLVLSLLFLSFALAATDPTVIDGRSHTVGAWSNETTITVEWIGATDAAGVEGYSFSWTKDTTGLPDIGIDTATIDFNRPTVAAGDYHTVGLKSDGTMVAVGRNVEGQTNVSGWTDIVAVAAGTYYTVGLKSDGTVVAAGSNNYGQSNVSGWTDIVAVAAGTYQTVGLKSDGTAVAVGLNAYGQSNVSAWTDIVAIAATGASHTVGLKSDGTVVAAGSNSFGQSNVSAWTDIVAIAAGMRHTVGLKSDGTVVAAGSNWYGQANVSAWTDIVAVAAGDYHTVGLKSDGTMVAVGSDVEGETNVSAWTGIRQPTYTATYTVPEDGDWHFNLRTKDDVGNWTSTVHLGPFKIDATGPETPATGTNQAMLLALALAMMSAGAGVVFGQRRIGGLSHPLP